MPTVTVDFLMKQFSIAKTDAEELAKTANGMEQLSLALRPAFGGTRLRLRDLTEALFPKGTYHNYIVDESILKDQVTLKPRSSAYEKVSFFSWSNRISYKSALERHFGTLPSTVSTLINNNWYNSNIKPIVTALKDSRSQGLNPRQNNHSYYLDPNKNTISAYAGEQLDLLYRCWLGALIVKANYKPWYFGVMLIADGNIPLWVEDPCTDNKQMASCSVLVA